jgi:hypothetical protein
MYPKIGLMQKGHIFFNLLHFHIEKAAYQGNQNAVLYKYGNGTQVHNPLYKKDINQRKNKASKRYQGNGIALLFIFVYRYYKVAVKQVFKYQFDISYPGV